MWLTAWVHQRVLGLPGVIDMRELIVEYCVLAGVVTAAAARLLAPLRLAARILILVLLFLVLSEATFADYAASPFTETAALYGMLIFAIAGVTVAVRPADITRRTWSPGPARSSPWGPRPRRRPSRFPWPCSWALTGSRSGAAADGPAAGSFRACACSRWP